MLSTNIHFGTDIRHLPGKDNPVVDALSRVERTVMMPVIVDTEELAQQ